MIPGGFYGRHHDFMISKERSTCGPRVLTFLVYLNDVEEGGATSFSHLGVNVAPKRGRAIVWANIVFDERTAHEALPVIKGTKYASQVWWHQYDERCCRPGLLGPTKD